MAGLTPDVPSCCDPCEEPQSVAVPGPQGPAGADGTNGTDGVNAFTTASLFVMPAELANVVVTVGDSTWMAVGQILFASAGGAVGHFQVIATPTSTSVTLKNLEDTANDAYPENSAPGTNFPNGTQISPAGLQGPIGVTPAGAFLIVNNLNEGNAAAMRTSLGLGALAILNTVNNTNWSGADLDVSNGGTGASTAAAARTSLGAAASGLATASGLTISTVDRILGLTAAGPAAVQEIPCTAFARTLLDDVDATAARATLGVSATIPYEFRVTNSAPQGFANITATQVQFDTAEFDPQTVWASDEYTAQADGKFFFKAQVFWGSMPAGDVELEIQFRVNAAIVSRKTIVMASSASGLAGIDHSDELELSNTDVVQLWAAQTSGGGESTDSASTRTFFCGWAITTS